MGYTEYNAQLTPKLKELILEFVETNNANPTGIWRDFQCVHRSWRNLQNFVDTGLILESEVPDEPDPTDYPDTLSSATLACPESCCKDCGSIKGCQCASCSNVLEVVNGPVLEWTGLTLDDWSSLELYDWQVLEV